MDVLATDPAPSALLDRHQRRRDAGLPTLSVLSGPVGLAAGTGRRWAEDRGRAVVVVGDPTFDGLTAAWADALADGRDLAWDASDWLAARLDRPAAELGPWIGRMAPFDREAFLESVLPEDSGDGVEAACRWLLTRSPADPPVAGLRARLGDHLIGALHAIVPPGGAPVLIAAGPSTATGMAPWLESAATSLARIASMEPRLTLLMAVEAGTLDHYRRLAPESRAKSLIRAGTIDVAARDAPGGRREPPGAADPAHGHDEASPRGRARDEPGPDDPARSAAERFLFDRLESLPQTAGLFALNTRLDFPFGAAARAIEVDLVARTLGLAVEIDGYHHFRDADAYRRDRRKDFELQRRGFLVVRVLAEDVAARLEEVLDLILAAVASRSPHDGSGTPRNRGSDR